MRADIIAVMGLLNDDGSVIVTWAKAIEHGEMRIVDSYSVIPAGLTSSRAQPQHQDGAGKYTSMMCFVLSLEVL